MSRLTLFLVPLAATSFATMAAAQQRPDFSGVWAAAAERPAGAAAGDPRAPSGGVGARFSIGDMGSGWGSPITVAQGSNRLTVEYDFFTAYDLQPPITFTYALDGSETRNSVMMGRGIQEQRAKCAWTGDTLVITTLHTFAHPQDGKPIIAEVRQALTLASPASLVIETTRLGVLGGPTATTRTVYTKR